ncbi:MAG: translation initiation factor IF-2 [Minisyncoccales bacterium]
MVKKQTTITGRPPVVVVLGHIDHGKSSLLEAIRDFKITAKEAGGITQHVGAYQIVENNKKITFIDTPGHEAFSQMRARGIKVADIALLVIDAVEGVKSQTQEAIQQIKQTGIPTIVVLNKIDKPLANPEKVKRELAKNDFLVESLGGKIPCVEVSAQTKQNIPALLEMILLVAEMEELKTDSEKPAEGVVIESYLDNLRGPTATLLITDGYLKIGDLIATNSAFVKVKKIENFQKTPIKRADAADPVIIFGFNQTPQIGEQFKVVPDLAAAEAFIKQTEKKVIKITPIEKIISEGKKWLNLVLKTDVLGSKEAIEGILQSLPQDKVVLRILKSEVGQINESDVKLALNTSAKILGFRVKMDAVAKKMVEREKVKVLLFEVIYNLIEAVRQMIERAAVEAEETRIDLGKVRVLAHFLTEKSRQIIGGKVIEGEVKKGALIEVWRTVQGYEEKIGQGKAVNLQKNKKDVALVGRGDECGILFEGNVKIEKGDILLFYLKEKNQ